MSTRESSPIRILRNMSEWPLTCGIHPQRRAFLADQE